MYIYNEHTHKTTAVYYMNVASQVLGITTAHIIYIHTSMCVCASHTMHTRAYIYYADEHKYKHTLRTTATIQLLMAHTRSITLSLPA
jgi:hypothetical protein